ncbi:hypothetical protein N9Y17_04140, partial [Gammaproteobacteria bacterium]|nr:hypothetical protein [Gammaproteobacteria bacterium]
MTTDLAQLGRNKVLEKWKTKFKLKDISILTTFVQEFFEIDFTIDAEHQTLIKDECEKAKDLDELKTIVLSYVIPLVIDNDNVGSIDFKTLIDHEKFSEAWEKWVGRNPNEVSDKITQNPTGLKLEKLLQVKLLTFEQLINIANHYEIDDIYFNKIYNDFSEKLNQDFFLAL